MNQSSISLITALMLTAASAAGAATSYNTPPAGDKLYPACVKEINESYQGGNEKSHIRCQGKSQAYCICLWNETPDEFKGSLAAFAESEKGKGMKKMCEAHANWRS